MKLRDKSKNKRRFLHNDLFKRTMKNLFWNRKEMTDWEFQLASLRMGMIRCDPPPGWMKPVIETE